MSPIAYSSTPSRSNGHTNGSSSRKEPSSPTMTTTTATEHSPAAQSLFVSTTVLGQALELLQTSITSDSQISFQSKSLPGSTIGKHLRHARDHFNLLLECTQSTTPPLTLSYDVRTRNTPMETSLSAAIEALQQTIAHLEDVLGNGKVALDESVSLSAITPFPQVLQSSFGRELWFASLHAIHHWSMIRVIAAEQDITVDEAFGVAPSTLSSRGHEGPLGKARI